MKHSLFCFFFFLISISLFSEEVKKSLRINWESQEFLFTFSIPITDDPQPDQRYQKELIVDQNLTQWIKQLLQEVPLNSLSTIGNTLVLDEKKNQMLLKDLNYISGTLNNKSKSYEFKYSLPFNKSFKNLLVSPYHPKQKIRPSYPFISSAQFTGVLIYAKGIKDSNQRSLEPVLFPKLYNKENILLYTSQINSSFWHYSKKIPLRENNSIIGSYPLRLYASGISGTRPANIILSQADSARILSAHCQSLLQEGRVLIIY